MCHRFLPLPIFFLFSSHSLSLLSRSSFPLLPFRLLQHRLTFSATAEEMPPRTSYGSLVSAGRSVLLHSGCRLVLDECFELGDRPFDNSVDKCMKLAVSLDVKEMNFWLLSWWIIKMTMMMNCVLPVGCRRRWMRLIFFSIRNMRLQSFGLSPCLQWWKSSEIASWALKTSRMIRREALQTVFSRTLRDTLPTVYSMSASGTRQTAKNFSSASPNYFRSLLPLASFPVATLHRSFAPKRFSLTWSNAGGAPPWQISQHLVSTSVLCQVIVAVLFVLCWGGSSGISVEMMPTARYYLLKEVVIRKYRSVRRAISPLLRLEMGISFEVFYQFYKKVGRNDSGERALRQSIQGKPSGHDVLNHIEKFFGQTHAAPASFLIVDTFPLLQTFQMSLRRRVVCLRSSALAMPSMLLIMPADAR